MIFSGHLGTIVMDYSINISSEQLAQHPAAFRSLIKMQSGHIVSGAENGAERAKNRVERSRAERGAVVAKKRWSGSGARSGRSRSGNGAFLSTIRAEETHHCSLK